MGGYNYSYQYISGDLKKYKNSKKNKRDGMQENLPAPTSAADQPFDDEFLKLLPPCIAEGIKLIPPDWFSISEEELKLRCDNCRRPGVDAFETDEKLRALFWLEHAEALNTKSVMRIQAICQDVIQQNYFIYKISKIPHRLAWILTPFGSHIAEVAIMVKRGNARLKEVMELPLTRKICRCHWRCVCLDKVKLGFPGVTSKCCCTPECICPELVDHKVGELIIKIYDKIETRAKGSVPQVVNQRIQSMNLHRHITTPAAIAAPSMEEIDARIRELELATSHTPTLPPSREIAEIIDASAINQTDSQTEKEKVLESTDCEG